MNGETEKFRGIFPALITPYTKDGTINEASLRLLVSRCLERGARGFYVCGSTGEAFMLSLDERKRILEIVTDEVSGQGTIIAHVGCISTDQSIELARHARDVGVDAVSSVPPFYYGFTVDEIVSHYSAVTDAVDMPMILYNFPANSGFTLTTAIIRNLRDIDSRIIGLKHTSMNLYELEQALRIDDEFVVFAGHDEVLLGAVAMGAHGAIGSTYNVMPELYVEMMDLANRGEIHAARSIQMRVNSFIRLMKPGTGIPQIKAALGFLGIECHGCRRPIAGLSREQEAAIEQALINIGVLKEAT